MREIRILFSFLVSLGLVLQPVISVAQTRVGTTQKLAKLVEGRLGANARKVVLRDPVYQNEIITTGADSAVEFRFIDDTTLTLGPDSDAIIDDLVYDPNGKENSLVVTMVHGAFKFVSGKMVSKSYVVKTPTVTVGIRGTVFTVYVAANGATTVSVIEGAVSVSNVAGISQSVTSGFSSTTTPPPAGGTPPPPSSPGPPPANAQAAIQNMDNVVANAESATGSSASSTGATGTGGLTAGAVAAGIGIAAALAAALSLVTGDDDASTTSSTSTSTSTSTSSATSTN